MGPIFQPHSLMSHKKNERESRSVRLLAKHCDTDSDNPITLGNLAAEEWGDLASRLVGEKCTKRGECVEQGPLTGYYNWSSVSRTETAKKRSEMTPIRMRTQIALC